MEITYFAKYLFIVTILSSFKESLTQDFSYEGNLGPEHWHEYYTTCHGKYQSPINIDIHQVKKVSLPPLIMTGFDVSPNIAYIRNNGHTVQVTMDFSTLPSISGGPLNDTYEFAQFHYHWGGNDTYGSEDTIDNHSYPIELHIVFYKAQYKKFENALNFPDGIVVLAYFYQVSNDKNEFYHELSSLLDTVIYPGNQTKFINGPMIGELTTNDTEHYFTYIGSLTTPPCSEVVTWIDFATPIPISSEQISKFRSLHDNEGHQLTHNYRPIQPLNGRIIYENVPKGKETTDEDQNKSLKPNDDENGNKIDNQYNEKESNFNDLTIDITASPTDQNNANDESSIDDIDSRINYKFRGHRSENSSSKTFANLSLLLIILFANILKF